jgi:hypothetical protein
VIAIRAIYDGKEFRPLGPFPVFDREVSVIILFPEDSSPQSSTHKSQREIAEEMLAARDAMKPLGCSVSDLIREGRAE